MTMLKGLPQKGYNTGQDVYLEIGAFYGPSVLYHYKVVRTGQCGTAQPC